MLKSGGRTGIKFGTHIHTPRYANIDVAMRFTVMDYLSQECFSSLQQTFIIYQNELKPMDVCRVGNQSRYIKRNCQQ